MSLRQVDIYVPTEKAQLGPIEEEFDLLDRWDLPMAGDQHFIRALVETKNIEPLVDWLDAQFADYEEYRIVIKPVQATIPRPEISKKEPAGRPIKPGHESVSRISREEVYQNVRDTLGATPIYAVLVVLSAIVAAGGMMRDSTAVVIGAMVIAPLLGPNIAVALGATLGDIGLLRRGVRYNAIGTVAILGLSGTAGFLLPFDPSVGEIITRTEVNIADVALALAAGAAGVLAVTRGVSTALIGVMVAVALLPPMVAVGLLAGDGHWRGAFGAMWLTITNIVAINLAGVVTFLAQGIRPTTWYEEKKAKQSRLLAIALWLLLLVTLAVAILLGAPPAPPDP